MLSISLDGPRRRRLVSRRELLRIGGLGLSGLSLPNLLVAQSLGATQGVDSTFGRAKSVIFLFLQGGPPQHETFDPKPDAPADIRGPFRPIQTNVSGIQIGELLPRTARLADKLAIVRSIATDANDHEPSGYWVLTGNAYRGTNPRTIQPSDAPYMGSLVKLLKPSDTLPALSVAWIPDWCRLNEGVRPAGQTGGFLGSQWDPERFVGDPNEPGYRVEGLSLPERAAQELHRRADLLRTVERDFAQSTRGDAASLYSRSRQQAFDLLTSEAARRAFAVDEEPAAVRERYGRNRWGQCVLLARRLVEAGVRLVHVNWPRDPGDAAVDNPLWDTHAQNADRLEDVLCPQFDLGFSALLDDLDQRGLLESTLVVAIGEFGRTPRINAIGGRDHWGSVFSFALAGAGIRGGMVYGASDKHGAFPARDRVDPGHLWATILHLVGIDPRGEYLDRESRPHRLTRGEPIHEIVGSTPATLERVAPEGDLARLVYDERKLAQTDFSEAAPIRAADFGSRPKGWRAAPLESTDGCLVRAMTSPDGAHYVALGVFDGTGAEPIAEHRELVLGQEMRNPRVGRYHFSVWASGGGDADSFEHLMRHFRCRLVIFRFRSLVKDPRERDELAAVEFQPSFSQGSRAAGERFDLEALLDSSVPGQNFAIGSGLGVAVVLTRSSPGELPREQFKSDAYVAIERVSLDYVSRERNEKVQI